MTKALDIDVGSGNVFTDLGLADADERSLRTKLAVRLNDLIQSEGLTQALVAKHLGISQPHVSELKNYKLSRFSSERLLHYITLFNHDVEIFIRPCVQPVRAGSRRKPSVGAVSVWAAV
jgi:predicted XRE-type DNA-binding protein